MIVELQGGSESISLVKVLGSYQQLEVVREF